MSKQLKKADIDRLFELKRRDQLPHIYGWKWYKWAYQFYTSTNRFNFLCAANQISKSSTQIRKAIEWATNKELWPKLWRNQPHQFWYLYPTKPVATTEFFEKWETEFLPRGDMKKDPVYGWESEMKNKEIWGIHFNSGVSIYFKTYEQDTQNLQTGTVHAIFCFAAGTLVKAKSGLCPIEEIKIGDVVLSKDGWKKVTRIYESISSVITREFSNGEKITATKEHPFYTKNRGWVSFGELTGEDACVNLPLWKLQRKLYYLRELFLNAFLNLKTLEKKIISGAEGFSYILNCGRIFIRQRFPQAMLSTTGISIPWITESKTYSVSQEQSTQEFIKNRNGRAKNLGHLNAWYAVRILNLDPLREKFQGTVLCNAVEKIILKLENAWYVVRNFLLEKIQHNAFVLSSTPIEGVTKVYNLEVDDSHTYYANGILVHNCDEELDFRHFNELRSRLNYTSGHFHMVFTATLGQDEWRRTMEPNNRDEELFVGALKLQISMYDCLYYMDKSPSSWTLERIKEIERECATEAEVQKRVFGRFILSGGLKCQGFDRIKNLTEELPPKNWAVYTGVDCGAGGEKNHPAAIVLLAVRPDYKYAVVFKGWRGDGIATTSSDILKKHTELLTYEIPKQNGELEKRQIMPVLQSYDWHNKDFQLVAQTAGVSFTPADKSKDRGESLLNTLFKLEMLKIYDKDPELSKLVIELTTLKSDAPKVHAKDDFYDSLRYCVMSIPWDFQGVAGELIKTEDLNVDKRTEKQKAYDERRSYRDLPKEEKGASIEDEFDEWQQLIDGT